MLFLLISSEFTILTKLVGEVQSVRTGRGQVAGGFGQASGGGARGVASFGFLLATLG